MKKLTKADKVSFLSCVIIVIIAIMWILLIWVMISYAIQENKYKNLEELRPCPFCGTTDLEYERYNIGGYENGTPDMTEVRCENCHARVTIWYEGDSNIPDAKEIWNRRK